MKIFCIGRNYKLHAKELGNEVPQEPVIFLKPETALLRKGQPFFYPLFSDDIHYEAELVVRICRTGKGVNEKFASRYYDAVTVGIDFTARDLQSKLKSKGLPWEISKGFDGSAVVGEWLEVANFKDIQNIDFSLEINETEVQEGHSKDMIFSVNQIIAYISNYYTLKIGDILFTGTPAGVGKINKEDVLKGYLEGENLFSVKVK